jgi:hypothetical protein
MKCRNICSVASKSATTPWRRGRPAVICAGVRPIICRACSPTACTLPRQLVDRDDRGLEQHDPLAAAEDNRVRRTQIDG